MSGYDNPWSQMTKLNNDGVAYWVKLRLFDGTVVEGPPLQHGGPWLLVDDHQHRTEKGRQTLDRVRVWVNRASIISVEIEELLG